MKLITPFKILLSVLVLFFFSCQDKNNQLFHKNTDVYLKEELTKLRVTTKTIEIEEDNTKKSVYVNINADLNNIMTHDEYKKMFIAYTYYLLGEKNNAEYLFLNYNDDITIKYDVREQKNIENLFNNRKLQDSYRYLFKNVNAFDMSMLDSYVQKVNIDFAEVKENFYEVSFIELIDLFYKEILNNKKGVYGKAQRTMVFISMIDEEFDVLNTERKYSKIIKEIWDIISPDKSLKQAKRELFSKKTV